jgi:hypothetical protein
VNVLWLYNIPNWALGLLIVASLTAGAVLGHILVRRRMASANIALDNQVVSSYVGAVGVFYAVLLAMIAVASWTNYTAVEALVMQESNLVHAMFRDARAFPPPHGDRLRSTLRDYVDVVVNVEWPALRKDIRDRRAALAVDAIFDEWMVLELRTEKEKIVAAETFQRMNTFQTVRQDRIQTGLSGLLPVLWVVVFVGAALNITLTFLFHIENQRVHLMMTALLAITIGMVVYLIVALDHPLWGEVSVPPTAFERVGASMDRELNPMTPGERRLSPEAIVP